MISLFTLPKPFLGDDKVRQRNALESWVRLKPDCEVILLGNEEGIEEASKEFGTEWIANVNRNEFGTPLLDDAFEKAKKEARYNILCYVNADIILCNDIKEAVSAISFEEFLGTSKRYNIDSLNKDEHQKLQSYSTLKEYVRKHVTPDNFYSMDIFMFNRNTHFGLPPFAVGRPGWDQWMVFRARQMRIPVIDLSEVVTVIHQVHDYDHVPQAKNNSWRGPEADKNFKLIGNIRRQFNLKYATHKCTPSGIRKIKGRKSLSRWWNEKIALYPKCEVPLQILASVTLFFRKLIRGH